MSRCVLVALAFGVMSGVAHAKALPEKQWRTQANAICERFHEDRDAILPESGLAISTAAEAQPYVDQAVPLYEGLVASIDALTEPRPRRKGVKRFVRSLTEAVQTIEENPLMAFSGFQDPFATANEIASTLRLRSCTGLGDQRL